MFEKFISMVRPGYSWTHEMTSIQIFQKIVDDNIHQFQKYQLDEKDILCIKVIHLALLLFQRLLLSGDHLRPPGWCHCFP